MSAARDAWWRLDATGLAQEHASGARSVAATLESCIARIERLAPRWNVFLALDLERARSRARALEGAAAPGRLHGVPLAIKANFACDGLETSCGSRLLAGWKAPYTATAVARLEAAGAIVVGATNMDEFGMGSTGENSAYGPARNPWDETRAPGGSSSGSAAAVAGGLVPLALGSDTGGSVRQPAAWCGLAGFKPGWGRVSRHGLVAYASSLDCVAALARSMRDLELAVEIMAGPDGRDATCDERPAPAREAPRSLEGLVVGVPREWRGACVHSGALERFEDAVRAARELGARVAEVELPLTRHAVACYYVLAAVEASSNLGRYDGLRYGRRAEDGARSLAASMSATRGSGFGAEVKRRIVIGTYALSAGWSEAWHAQAAKVRALVAREFDDAFAQCDLLLGPTTPTPATRLGAHGGDPLALYACDALTTPVSLAGLPAANLRLGAVLHDGALLPCGAQLAARRGQDMLALAAARLVEERLGTHGLWAPGAEADA